ncbi:MAG: hypothetical protein AAGA48_34140 [Myxococcota bacterium]
MADAERIKPETVYEVLQVEKGQDHWDDRRRVLQDDLPRLVSGSPRPARRTMDLLRRFASTTTHGADLWWCRWLPEDVRKKATRLAERFWVGHRVHTSERRCWFECRRYP